MNKEAYQLLLVSDHEYTYVTVSALLVPEKETPQQLLPQYHVHRVHSLNDALKEVIAHRYAAILLDGTLTDAPGLIGLNTILQVVPEIPIIMLGGKLSRDDEDQAIALGAEDWLVLGAFGPAELLRTIRHAIARGAKRDQLQQRFESHEMSLTIKNEFLDGIHHQLCRPLTAIVGYTEMLISEKLPLRNKRSMLEAIQRNGNHLLRLIKSTLDFSSLKSGVLPVEYGPCSPLKLLGQVDRKMRKKALARGFALSIVHETPIPEQILTDADRLQQILYYLLGVAIELATKDRILITVNCDRELQQLSIGISYSGHVISDAEKSHPHFGEVELELEIAQEIAGRLGGLLHIQSPAAGFGRFLVSIDTGPLDGVGMVADGLRAPARINAGPQRRFAGRVLIADDCPDTQVLFAHHLARCGLHVTFVENGREVLEVTRKAVFDLIILDSHMPVLDGYATASLLKRRGYSGPLIAFTAATLKQGQDFTDYLPKPFTREALYSLLGTYLKEQPAVEPHSPELTLEAIDSKFPLQ